MSVYWYLKIQLKTRGVTIAFPVFLYVNFLLSPIVRNLTLIIYNIFSYLFNTTILNK